MATMCTDRVEVALRTWVLPALNSHSHLKWGALIAGEVEAGDMGTVIAGEVEAAIGGEVEAGDVSVFPWWRGSEQEVEGALSRTVLSHSATHTTTCGSHNSTPYSPGHL